MMARHEFVKYERSRRDDCLAIKLGSVVVVDPTLFVTAAARVIAPSHAAFQRLGQALQVIVRIRTLSEEFIEALSDLVFVLSHPLAYDVPRPHPRPRTVAQILLKY